MKVNEPSNQVLDELKRYAENLLGFFDSKASVKISTNYDSRDSIIQVEVFCKSLMNEQQLNRIALERILTARMSNIYPDGVSTIKLSINKTILIN